MRRLGALIAAILASMPRLILELVREAGRDVWRLAKILFPTPGEHAAAAEAAQVHELALCAPHAEAEPDAEMAALGDAVLAALCGEEADIDARTWRYLQRLDAEQIARLATASTWEIGAHVLGTREISGLIGVDAAEELAVDQAMERARQCDDADYVEAVLKWLVDEGPDPSAPNALAM